ncbi:MAG: hypothetical protein U5R14_12925 [Gemmatimonadota bacterium]|nr:hypothetical protein [Gemmatimonadota bacterium]
MKNGSRLWWTRLIALTCIVPLGTACFTYQAVDAPEPALGQDVRVELTGAGRDNLMERRALALSDVTGQVLSHDTSDVLLRARVPARHLGPGHSETLVDTLRIPQADIRQMQVKTLSRERSIAAGALAVAGVAGTYALFQATLSGSGSERQRTDPNFSLPLSWLLGILDFGR